MIRIRPAHERGHADYGWLDTWYSFSFADYHDPQEMGWGTLRVINDDRVAAGKGFGTHGHRDMEIVTYVLAGALEHKDSLGNGTVIRPGEVQRMSAGRGVMHSEFNPSAETPTQLLQIWIQPNVRGGAPSYEQKTIADSAKRGRLQVIASADGRDGSVTIQQDAAIHAALLAAGEEVGYDLAPERLAYVHVVAGRVSLNGVTLATADGAKIADESHLTLRAESDAEILFFDLGGQA